MLKQILIYILLSLICFNSFGQREDRIWYFGGDPLSPNTPGAGLDFNSSVPVSLLNSAMGYTEGSAVQADRNGNLLFYTNGVKVWDSTHSVMFNGAGLGGNISSLQSSVIIPFPSFADTSKFYIFANDGLPTANGTGLHYSIIDMSLHSGLGAVTATKAFPLLNATSEGLTATQHTNGVDFWVVTTDYDSAIFYAYKISSSGISSPVISNLGYDSRSAFKLDFNNKGNKITFISRNTANALYSRTICDFDQTTGVFYNPVPLDTTAILGGGAGFSPNDSLFYSVMWTGPFYYNSLLLQYDLFAANIQTSMQTIAQFNTSPHFDMKNGPDGKLYLSNATVDSIDRINSPNSIGQGCNFQKNAIYLNGKKYRFIFPNKTFEIAKSPLSVQENNYSGALFTLYPNPATEYFTIAKNRVMKSFFIYNSLGQQVYKADFDQTKQQETVTLQLLKGVFFIVGFDEGGNSYTEKLVIN